MYCTLIWCGVKSKCRDVVCCVVLWCDVIWCIAIQRDVVRCTRNIRCVVHA